MVGMPVYRAELAREVDARRVSRDTDTADRRISPATSTVIFNSVTGRVFCFTGSFRDGISKPRPSTEPKLRILWARTSIEPADIKE